MHVSVEATRSSDTGKCWSGFLANPGRSSWQPGPGPQSDSHRRVSFAVLAADGKETNQLLRSKMATLLVIVSAMLVSAFMSWQQRMLFIGGIAFGLVVEALPRLVEDLKERAAEWRHIRQFTGKTRVA